ncbi:hypothetical protein BCV70DRAFT_238977, partial [Testicularia cyperi]
MTANSTAKLGSIGAVTRQAYLNRYASHTENDTENVDTPEVPVAPDDPVTTVSNPPAPLSASAPASVSVAVDTTKTDPKAAGLGTPTAPGVDPNAAHPPSAAREQDVPLYYKLKGKGKGRAVFYDPGRSNVAQLFEVASQLSLPEPTFNSVSCGPPHRLEHTVTVDFMGLVLSDDT